MSGSPLLLSFLDPSSYLPLHAMNDVQTLLVDGYISRTFRSQVAEQYFLNLLKSSFIPPHTVLSYAGREGYFFFLHFVPSHIPVQHSGPPSCCWLLDRGITDRRTVVPQKMWSPHSVPDRIRHVVAAQLQMPVFLRAKAGTLAFLLQHPPTWPGYKEFKRQVLTREHTSTRNPISMAGFARQIGRTVDTFLQVCELDPESDDGQRDLWRIWRGGIRGSDIVIIGAVQVSAGSWMPIIQLDRYDF
ncbi:hypothetical protein EDB89DRAFT_1902230 [Lactarius sanguifluus]|nr:hypothetical protein EDB89DRAFT_1902230 [Lactarius sanguifluus]